MPSSRPTLLVLTALLALLAGCSGPSPSAASAALQNRIQLAERGNNRATIDQTWIDKHPAEFSWGQGQGWRLGGFFSDRWAKPGFEVRVSGAEGDAVVFPNPGSRRDGREPVLIVNLKGQALVTLADADGKTDSFHGRGGARKRSGDDSPRVIGVTRIELLKSVGPAERPTPKAPTVLRTSGLAAPGDLTVQQLGTLTTHPVVDEQGTPRGVQAWDLRDIAGLLGAARVLAVVDAKGTVTAIDPITWADTSKRPTLRLNRRGAWKFQWLGPKGALLWDLPAAGDVAELQLQAP